ncbi:MULTISPECIES: MEDS domain-containing protein [Streptomyces]|uniref:MEDS domain-containing protein n=1 Tax=Streptomyces fuscus TaxID=3048495 RepID=A0ABT7J2A1_9ACTN|nr:MULTISPECIES: MEDS domain-containing protein [Streptomyces]MCM1975104.1 MEDS domain-containing protein [Streptomyces sp. G1]MDL2077882.1 MEDS domain-containing protein [Streptomyces fuscus]
MELPDRSERTVAVERLQLGDHACLETGDGETTWAVFTAYTRTSLARREKVLLVMDPDDLQDDEVVALLDRSGTAASQALASGQLALRRSPQLYLPDGSFDKERTVEAYRAEVERAHQEGWAGLRISADMGWAARAGVAEELLLDYEASVAPLFADPLFTAICWYDRQRFGRGLRDGVARVHPLRVAEPADCRTDYVETLREAVALQDASRPTRISLDLRGLCFMEAHCAWQLISLAASLPPDSRVSVRCGELLALVLRQLGADSAPQLVLDVAEEAVG